MFAGSSSLDFDGEVDARGSAQTERSCYPLQIELIDIEDVPLRMARVGLQVRPVAIFCGAVEVVVPLYQLSHLFTDVGKLLGREFVLIWTDLALSQEPQEAKLMLKEEQESLATSFRASTRSTNSMNVVIRVIGWVKLDNPVDLREIKTSLRDICAEQNALFRLAEFKVSRGTLLLFLFAVDVLNRYVDVVEQI